MSTWREDVETALRSIGGQGTLSQIYEAVRARVSRPLPATWQAIVRRELEYNSSDSESYQQRYDLFFSVRGIGAGVWGLRELETFTPEPEDIQSPPERVPSQVYRILRDTQMARRLKKAHGDQCQLCDTALALPNGGTYSEAHHIRPLGAPHFGPDHPGNIIVLCPNHHALLDYGALRLEARSINRRNIHGIDPQYIDYHNRVIVPPTHLEPRPPIVGRVEERHQVTSAEGGGTGGMSSGH